MVLFWQRVCCLLFTCDGGGLCWQPAVLLWCLAPVPEGRLLLCFSQQLPPVPSKCCRCPSSLEMSFSCKSNAKLLPFPSGKDRTFCWLVPSSIISTTFLEAARGCCWKECSAVASAGFAECGGLQYLMKCCKTHAEALVPMLTTVAVGNMQNCCIHKGKYFMLRRGSVVKQTAWAGR